MFIYNIKWFCSLKISTKVRCPLLQHLHKSRWTLVRFEKNSLGYWHMFLKSFDIATSSCVTKPRHETFIISFYSMLALIFCVGHKIFRAVLIWPHCYIFSDTFVKCKDQYLQVVIQFWVYSSTRLPHYKYYILSPNSTHYVPPQSGKSLY